MCYKRLVMEQASTTAAALQRQRLHWTLAPALLAALTTLALFGCPMATQFDALRFQGTVDDQKYDFEEAIEPLVLPEAASGHGSLTYSLSPDIPGLTFDADTRTLSGTPTERNTYDMTYTAKDTEGRKKKLTFTIVVERFTLIREIMSAVAVGDAEGVPRFQDVPAPSGGPAVAVTGNQGYAAGGVFFLEIEPASTVDKLLLSIRGASFGFYEIDVDDTSSSHRLIGHIPFDLLAGLPNLCLDVAAVDAAGAVGEPECHPFINLPVGSGDVQVTVSWDSDADLDLHVADPNGDEVYYFSEVVESGGEHDLYSNENCDNLDHRRNEHIAWTGGPPPAGLYEVRVSHDSSCDAAETNYIVNVYNHGEVTSFSGTFTGSGERVDRGSGRIITRFTVGEQMPQSRPRTLSSTYRGSGDQVFVLNPDGEVLDDTLYTLDLGTAEADVYVIATAGNYHVEHRVEILAAASASRAAAQEDHQQEQRQAGYELAAMPAWITEMNNFNDAPPVWEGLAEPGRNQAVQARPAVAQGDRYRFFDLFGEEYVPATVRRVVTDGTRRVAIWVADQEWHVTCASRGDCVTQPMADAVADRFLRRGADNDIYDWVTNVFGAPWGPHDVTALDGSPIVIPPEAADEIHIFLFDIENDGYPTGPRIVGYFASLHNLLRQPPPSLRQYSSERLAFFMDSPYLAFPTDDTWEISDRHPSVIIDTLAHEFQHMIHFYQKPVVRDTVSEAWLNELASEVATDLIADKLMIKGPRGVASDDPTAGEPDNLSGRLPDYNLYNDIQVTAWDEYLANYSINYAFGAYLARNYGGAELFANIVQSDRAGVRAVEGALRDLGHDASFVQLLTNWGAANLLSDNTDAAVPYRYNAGTWSTSRVGSIEYRLGSINLYNYIYAPGRLARPGPYLHPLPSFNDGPQVPHSNRYTTLGRHTGAVRLRVSAESENRITVVVKE